MLGDYSLAAITPDLVAGYRDQRLEEGLSASTVRLELALLSHLFTVAIKEWRIGLVYNPVANIRKPPPHRKCLKLADSGSSTYPIVRPVTDAQPT